MTAGLRPLLDAFRLAWYRWALAELSANQPMHRDLPYVMHRVNQLERGHA